MSQHQSLVRSTSLPGAILLGLGSIIGTGAFVSVGFGVELAGNWIIWAILLAALVATCNGLSSAQLAAIHPVSGGTYEYGYEFLTHDLGFTAGWLFVLAKSASAATAALAVGFAITGWFGGPVWLTQLIGGVVLLALTLLVLGGLRRSNQANAVLVGLAILGLLIFIGYSFSLPAPDQLQLPIPKGEPGGLLAAAALLFVAYTGYGRIATMGEEVQNPRHVIPRAIVVTMLVVTLVYLAIGWALLQYPAFTRSEDFVLANLIEAGHGAGVTRWLVTLAALIAMCGVILNLLLGVSRVILAMARRNDLPRGLALLNPARTSAPAAVWLTFAVMMVLVAIGDLRLAWSFSAFTVLIYYSITNLAALRILPAQRFVPRWISVLGLLSCLGLAVFVDLTVVITGVALMFIGLVWHRTRYSPV
ncbi:amino acid transporter [Pseudidiomarina salinarum]|uniref:Amino acid transporter n=1 Tax=Pseudidiomarina salinarum TaxID=435908 RepID=A0A094IU07_9GAMM|nr:APC family permease [Pseudidiomarina salinarum]KFZ30622.1 amino acid transporter [Pseudidiomarina salinarum]RUO69135.1 amino acid permease [Pseudidiomarina salinarum]